MNALDKLFAGGGYLEKVIDTVLDGLIIIDENGHIQSFNPAATKIFGYQPADVIGNTVKLLMPEPYHTAFDSFIEDDFNTDTSSIIGSGREVKAKRKDGTLFPLWLGINEMQVEGTRMFVSTVRDLTERYQAQQIIRDGESYLQAIVDNTVDGLITIDQQGAIGSFNKACEQIFGYSSFEVIGQNVKILMPEPFHQEHDGYLKNHISTGEKKIIGIGREVYGRRKNGEIFPLDLSVSEVQTKSGRVYSGILRDITERKKAEEQILRSNKELERFAFIASHDLQEPLRMISSFTTLLQDEYGDLINEEAKQYMGFIIDASFRMQNLVTDILEYSRIGTDISELEEFDADEQLDIALINLKGVIDSGKVNIRREKLPIITANATQFGRLLQNLISNAVKYSDDTRVGEITIDWRESNTEWVFAIKDNGIGIEEEHIDKIFTIFKRLHNKDEFTGTGIGLSECKRIVELFGGSIWVESAKNKGSTFFFSIPQTQITDYKNANTIKAN